MNEYLKNVYFEGNHNFVSGVCELVKDKVHVTFSGSNLALQYDLSASPGQEFVALTAVHERSMNSSTLPESKLAHLYLQLGEAATDSAIETIKDRVRPQIDEFKKLFDRYRSSDSCMDFDELRVKYNELKEWCDECVVEAGLGWDGIRGENETVEAYYHADPGLLDSLVSPDMSDKEIGAAAIEELFVNGVLFHPAAIAEVLSAHSEYLRDQHR